MLSFLKFSVNYTPSLVLADKCFRLKYMVASSAYIRNETLALEFSISFIHSLNNKRSGIDRCRISIFMSHNYV